MPTGVALRDVREQLFGAAERVLLRDGPQALTSRAVTTEAGVAKGVLHRHFTDFDAFLAELIEDRIARLGPQATALREAAGTGTVAGNLTTAVTDLAGSVAMAIIPLITFDNSKYFPLVKNLEIQFVAMAKSDVRAEATLDDETIARVEAEAAQRGKADFTLDAVVIDAEGQTVATTRGLYQLRAIRS